MRAVAIAPAFAVALVGCFSGSGSAPSPAGSGQVGGAGTSATPGGLFCCALNRICAEPTHCPTIENPCGDSERAIAAAGDEHVCEQILDERTLGVNVCVCGLGDHVYGETDALSECQTGVTEPPPPPPPCTGPGGVPPGGSPAPP